MILRMCGVKNNFNAIKSYSLIFIMLAGFGYLSQNSAHNLFLTLKYFIDIALHQVIHISLVYLKLRSVQVQIKGEGNTWDYPSK